MEEEKQQAKEQKVQSYLEFAKQGLISVFR